MPIKPERKKLYPENWERISLSIREKSDWKCELCKAKNGEPHPITKSKVVLTVHHINGDPTDNRRLNLLALCQRCHNKLDQPFRHPRKKVDDDRIEYDEYDFPPSCDVCKGEGKLWDAHIYRWMPCPKCKGKGEEGEGE